jgi:hypothetical protein
MPAMHFLLLLRIGSHNLQSHKGAPNKTISENVQKGNEKQLLFGLLSSTTLPLVWV